jgi:hypothetical protein
LSRISIVILTKASKPDREGLSNPFKLPRGEKLRKEIIGVFREQRAAILRFLKTGRKDQGPPPPAQWPDWDDFRLGALAISERMTPLLRLTWEQAADAFAPRVGLDPDAWSVVNPFTERMIEEAALAFCESTNETTSLQLDEALRKLREELNAGIVEVGESLARLTKRVNAIFDQATTSRARRIAWTETSRAVHAAQEQAAIHSGVVTGWKWLLSGDACPLCFAVAARCPAVRLGQPFAVIGDDPHYSTIKFPPLHPHCNCSMVQVLDSDDQPAWGDTLHDPDPATEDEHRRVAEETQARDDATLRKRMRPAATRRPRPLARKKKPLSESDESDQRGNPAAVALTGSGGRPICPDARRWSDFSVIPPGESYA